MYIKICVKISKKKDFNQKKEDAVGASTDGAGHRQAAKQSVQSEPSMRTH